ncbi:MULTISPECIES: glycosyltransferase family 2 protein [unclassified Variovorax]|jgi:hypothetical protein|uniref:glycosyltransferase family 2 protein n=1 Tax=unclassified Variovorax TaxID=663243 RepID=UPI002B2390CF|nr:MULTISPECIES: glycosyltransferase [unclassified Variovorax]MEB0059223.1 glycosyltransferase [Variovorax sp. LG9.2]MEB0112534.1 glycosyltransferase [Variovorax sp. RTB1]
MKANASEHIVVGIATAGRRDVLDKMLWQLTLQRKLPDCVIICPAADYDFDESIISKLPYPIEVVRGARGLCAQRNLILKKISDDGLVVFFDDDFYPAVDFLEKTISCFLASPDFVAMTGIVIVDGALGPGIEHDEALRILSSDSECTDLTPNTIYNVYGCNMAFRASTIRDSRAAFDENLPLYSWLEDVDFSRSMSAKGAIGQSRSLRGVHLATKRGRTSGVRFGYSQIANPIYMAKKGTFAWSRAFSQMGRNVTANLARCVNPEPWVDRRGRLKGNLTAFSDLFRGRLHPRRILDIS